MPNNDGFGIKITAAQIVDLAKVSKQIQSELNTIKDLKVNINSVDTSNIKTSIQTAIKEAFQSANVGKINVNATTNVGKASTAGLNNTASQIERINKAIASMSYDAKIARLSDGFKKTGMDAEEASKKIKVVQDAYNKLKDPTQKGNLTKNFETLNAVLLKTQNELNVAQIEAKQYIDTFKKAKLKNDIETWLKANTAATKEAKVAMQMYLDEINRGEITPFREKEIRSGIGTITTEMRQAGKLGNSFIETFKQGAKSFAEWTIASGSIMRAVYTVKEMYQAVYDVDTAMTELYKVTDETADRYNKFLTSANSNAQKLGRTVSSLVEQTAAWAKLGYILDQADEFAQISSIYAIVGDVDDETAVSDIVTVMKAYDIAADEAITIVNKYNKLGNEFATSARDLGAGLSNSASMLALGGMDINKSLALLTGGAEITQSAEELGNALKIGQMRIQGMKGELEGLGESYEDLESVSKIQTHILNLTDGQVNIMQEADPSKFRDYYDILEDISKVYDELEQTEQADLLETLFGKNRGNQGAAVIQAFQSGQVQKAYEATLNAQNSAYEEQAKWMESLEAKTQQFEAAFQSLSQTVLDSNFLKGLVDVGTDVINVLDWIIDKIGVLGATGLIGGGILAGKNIGRPKMFGLCFEICR